MTSSNAALPLDEATRIAEGVRHECRAALFSNAGWAVPRAEAARLAEYMDQLDLSRIIGAQASRPSAFSMIDPTCEWSVVKRQLEAAIEEDALERSGAEWRARVLVRDEAIFGTGLHRAWFGVKLTGEIYSPIVALEFAADLARVNILIANLMSVVGAYRWRGWDSPGERST